MILENELGKTVLENEVYKEITQIATLKVKGVYPYKKNDFVSCKFKDDNLNIKINIKVNQDLDVVKTCSKIQNKVRESILDMCGIDTDDINIDVLGFVKE